MEDFILEVKHLYLVISAKEPYLVMVRYDISNKYHLPDSSVRLCEVIGPKYDFFPRYVFLSKEDLLRLY